MSVKELVPGKGLKLIEDRFYIKMDIDENDSDMLDFSIWIKKDTWFGLSMGRDGMAEEDEMISASTGWTRVADGRSAGDE